MKVRISQSGFQSPDVGRNAPASCQARDDLTKNHSSASPALQLPLNKTDLILLNTSSDLVSVLSILQPLAHLTLKNPTKHSCSHFPDKENEPQIS
jgi:hypothetical protein